jgi:organic hydroperoxide reductase OsmC/OhrA
MSEHIATICWENRQEQFVDNHYSREHTWNFDGGVKIPASASPQLVPVPYSNPTCVDPEEAFVAALSSCHMLFFLSIAAKKHFVVESYRDRAIGVMSKNELGKLAISSIHLFPKAIFIGDDLPTLAQIEEMHDLAHHECFLANSVKADMTISVIEL